MRFLEQPTRHLFFTGKGGVGKTSMACATSIKLADRGRRVLLVSTDPASNLDEVLNTQIGQHPTPIKSVDNLWALNLDPEAAAKDYRERMVGPYRGILPETAIRSIEEQFSGACTVEIAAFDEFSKLLGDQSSTSEFDHVIFDTAPTGHTLRLLTLPSAWSGFMENNTTGGSCLGPLAGLQAQRQLYLQTVQALSNPAMTTIVLVSRPETSALNEAARTKTELQHLGVNNQHLVINGVLKSVSLQDEIAVAMQHRGESALASMPEALKSLEQTQIPLTSHPLLGIDALRNLDNPSLAPQPIPSPHLLKNSDFPQLSSLIDELSTRGHGVILAMGKGGVGKTTVASAVAIGLVARGFPVHLTTTDPADHLLETLGSTPMPGLTVSRIDPVQETMQYAAEVMQTAGAGLDEKGRALLEEDLRSPCTEEIAVFRAFETAISAGKEGFVVMDTAPTGHTILLLDAALAYHRETTRQTTTIPDAVENLLPRLRDPAWTQVLIVTLPEATPVHEARKLQDDLRRARIEPFAWVINQSLAPLHVSDPTLCHRQHGELPYIEEVCSQLATRYALIPWQAQPPQGLEKLLQLSGSNQSVLTCESNSND